MLFDQEYKFKLGDLTFDCLSMPGETPDMLNVWIPELKALFIGDNYYASFPNLYTLRGTKPRPALTYVDSLNKALALKPEIVFPSHGQPIVGAERVRKVLTQYRDAILYVHDATVRGMNEGKDAFTLMKTIKLPPELEVGEGYGAISWSVRGIYEGYAGWFDTDPATMYAVSPAQSDAELQQRPCRRSWPLAARGRAAGRHRSATGPAPDQRGAGAGAQEPGRAHRPPGRPAKAARRLRQLQRKRLAQRRRRQGRRRSALACQPVERLNR